MRRIVEGLNLQSLPSRIMYSVRYETSHSLVHCRTGSLERICLMYRTVLRVLSQVRGVAIFAKACFGHPSPSKQQKLNATANAFGAPDVLRTCHFATTIVNSMLAS